MTQSEVSDCEYAYINVFEKDVYPEMTEMISFICYLGLNLHFIVVLMYFIV